MSAVAKQSYFDLHITGLGYVNRVRQVKPRKGEPFIACDIAALTGPTDSVEYQYFDVRVSGADAKGLIKKYEVAVRENRKVLIGFRLGDLYVDQFTYSKGEKAGQPGVSLKARLLFISWIKVDGKSVYKAEAKVIERITADVDEEIQATATAPLPVQVNSEETLEVETRVATSALAALL